MSGTGDQLPQAAIDEEIDDDIIDDPERAEIERIEAEARANGWRPHAEYRGEPGRWIDAKTFVERGNTFLPIVRKQRDQAVAENAAMRSEMTLLRDEVTATRGDMQRLLDFSRRADQAGYDRAVRDLKVQQRDAVAAGDTTRYDEIEEQIDTMTEARREASAPLAPAAAPPAQPTPRPAVAPNPAVEAFVAENPWFTSDRVLNQAMIAEHTAAMDEFPGMTPEAQLETAKNAVMRRFPKKFGITEEPEIVPQQPTTRRPAAPMAPTPPAQRPGPRSRTGIDAIEDPEERKQARMGFDRAKRNMPDLSEADYLMIFNDPKADILAIQDEAKKRARK